MHEKLAMEFHEHKLMHLKEAAAVPMFFSNQHQFRTDELGDLLTGIIATQQPLEVIPDDDHLDSSDGRPFQSSFAARREDCVTTPGWRTKRKRLSMHEKLPMEFHERKLMYLKEEHDMTMQILHVELAMKEEERNRKQQQYQCSSQTSTSSGSRYFYL
ncbi:unnamed protein product, partial [Coregonus sp. 'balchen']